MGRGELTERRRDLYSLLCNAVWLRAAHGSVNTNQGRETAGIDGESMSDFNRDLRGQPLRHPPTTHSQNL